MKIAKGNEGAEEGKWRKYEQKKREIKKSKKSAVQHDCATNKV